MILSTILIAILGIGAIIKAMVFAETSPVGSLEVTYSEGANYVNENIVGKNFNLSVAEGIKATIKLNAEFAPGQDKKITIKVPTGLGISAYSATENTPNISGITKVEIDNAYKDYILASSLTAATSDTHILDKDGNPVKFANGAPWINQKITGYAKLDASTNEDQRVYGGDIEYTFADLATKVELVLVAYVQNDILSHTANTEVMGSISVTMTSSAGSIAQRCDIMAKDVQIFSLIHHGGRPESAASYNVLAKSDAENRSEQFGIGQYVNLQPGLGAVVPLSDELNANFTYPSGVYFDNKVVALGQTITDFSQNNPHYSIEVNENDGGGGVITIKLKNIRVKHYDPLQAIAYFRADTAIYTQEDPTLTIGMDYEYKRNGNVRSGRVGYRRTLIFPGSGRDMRISPRNQRLRDTDAEYGRAPFSYPLGSFAFSSALTYENVKLRFDFSEGMGVRAITVPGSDIREIVAATTKGRTITLDSVLGSADSVTGVMINEEILGLEDDEYLASISAVMSVVQGNYGAFNYIQGNCKYWGHFLNGEAGEARLSVIDNNTGEVEVNGVTGERMTAIDQTVLGWQNSGAGYYRASVKKYDNDTIFYPNTTIEFSGKIIYQNVQVDTSDLIAPTVIISLPEGLSLDTTSVRAQSLNGERGEEWFSLVQTKGGSEQVVDGVRWMTYYYGVERPYDFVVRGSQPIGSNYTTLDSTVVFNAIVDNAVNDYNLSLKDILSYDLGMPAISVTGNESFVYPDTANRSGKTTEGSVYNLAAAGGNIQIKPLIGLNIDIGIRTKGMNQDFMTYNGTESSIATIARTKPAEVKVYYESTSTSNYKKGSTIYMPVPKKGLDYAKYFENLEIESPMTKDDNNATFEYSTKLTSIPKMVGEDGTTWTTYFATNITGSNPNNYTVMDATWEPVVAGGSSAINWTKAEDFVANSGNNLKDVVMIKFVSDADITPGAKGSCIYDLELNSTTEREPNATNYWRTYNLAATEDNGTGIWNYSSIIAANADGIELAGQIFVDRNGDATYDSPDTPYNDSNNTYTVTLSRDDNTEPMRELYVDSEGKFKNRAKVGGSFIDFFLRQGDYTLTVTKATTEEDYIFSHIESNSTSNKNKYYNDIKNSEVNEENTVAVYKFTVDVETLSSNDYTKNIGIALAEQNLTLTYEWDGDIPKDVALPVDGNTYTSGNKVSLDTTFTKNTKIEVYEECKEDETNEGNGTNEGNETSSCEPALIGTYYFSGWTPDENIIDGDIIINNAIIKGTWRYEKAPEKPEPEPEPETPEEPEVPEEPEQPTPEQPEEEEEETKEELPVPDTGMSTSEPGTSAYNIGIAVMVAFVVTAGSGWVMIGRYLRK
ncbi:hypothetical protein IKF34_01775 [Candidatus Saccharibacteria bacterium]|nr:hypothetical protein [Candidatus Saccharibacteria bacterium]